MRLQAVLIGAFLLTPVLSGAAVPAPDEVGIDEKLGTSIPLDHPLLDENGKKITLGDILDKPTVLTLNYFQCAGICSPQLHGVVDVLNRVALEPGKDFQVVTISFDGRDTPRVAKEKRENFLKLIKRPISPSAWRFFTGEPAATKALADSVGFQFKPWGEDFIHPGVLILLSTKGKITRYMYGLSYLPADLQMAVIECSKGLAMPTVSKTLQFCYTLVPEGRKYVYRLTRIIGGGILFIAAAFVFFVLFKKQNREHPKKAAS